MNVTTNLTMQVVRECMEQGFAAQGQKWSESLKAKYVRAMTSLKSTMLFGMKPGETYAGYILGENGQADYHLFLLPDKPARFRLSLQDAQSWADSVGGAIPSQAELRFLFCMVYSAFLGNELHWSETVSEEHPNLAWCSSVNSEGLWAPADRTFFARAVRRVYV